ncbi:hypothetical protein JHK85_006647 [Glycine max]|nr:hypothetical protein JHK85_006647 [Glycine max]
MAVITTEQSFSVTTSLVAKQFKGTIVVIAITDDRDSSNDENSFPTNGAPYNQVSFEGNAGKSSERRDYGGPRGPYRGGGGRHGGFSNGETGEAEKGRPRRAFDRHSGTGRSRVTDEVANETEKNLGDEKPTVEEDAVESDNQELELDLSSLGAVNTMFAAFFSKLGVPIKTTVSATVLEEALNGLVTIRPLPLGHNISKRAAHVYVWMPPVHVEEHKNQLHLLLRAENFSPSQIDAISGVLLLIPCPLEWGAPTFDAGHAFGMVVTAYKAASRLTSATPPPAHVLSRGIGWQGIGILLNSLFGTLTGSTVSV